MQGRYSDLHEPAGGYTPNESTQDLCRHAKACCLVGWTYRVYGDLERNPVLCKLVETLRKQEPHVNIVMWNDNPKRTFQDIKELVEKADV